MLVLALSGIAYINRDALLPGEGAPTDPMEAAFHECMAERTAQIDALLEDGVLSPERAETSKQRLAPVCRAQVENAQ